MTRLEALRALLKPTPRPSVFSRIRLWWPLRYVVTARMEREQYREDSTDVAHAVREWAIANGDNALLRIALCGYDGEHEMPGEWSVYRWSAGDGFGGQATERTNNGDRERIWFSPSCIDNERPLFGFLDAEMGA